MAWFSKKRRLLTSPITIAELLHRIMAEEDNPQAAPEAFHLQEEIHARFRKKVFLYREANVLLALLTRCQQEPLFEQPLREYERILFPESPETPAGAARLQAMKTAMQDLRILVNPDDRLKLTWARNWFATLGHDETNPATLMLLSILWSDLHIAAHEGLKRMVV
jgi:hypothetical protein